jgi:hypothetical protein
MKIAPDQDRLDPDGKMTFIVAHDLSRANILRIFPEIFKGTHLRYTKFIDVFKCDEVTVKFRRISVIEEENGFYLCYASDPEEGNSDYAYLRENDNVITSGTGLYVGMTYNPEK